MLRFLSRGLEEGFGRFKVHEFIKYLLNRLHFLALTLLLLYYFEFLCRGSVIETLTWGMNNPLKLLLNFLRVFTLLLLFAAVAGRTWTAYTALSLVLTIIGFISGVKMRILGVPLMPWDVGRSLSAGSWPFNSNC